MNLAAHSFGPAKKVSASGHSRSFEETWAWVKPKLKRVPISRVLDVTPLDYVGLPVWSAVTPLARDLTVHAGKGPTAGAARLSAVMEGIERVSAETVSPGFETRGSFTALGSRAVDPRLFDLPFETRFTPDAVFTWVPAYCLLRDEQRLVARDLVATPPSEGVCHGVETNGLASGNTLTEATLHALYEVLERDAVSLEHFIERHGDAGVHRAHPVRVIDPGTLPDATRVWVEQLGGSGVEVRVQELTCDTNVPVFAVVLYDAAFPSADGGVAMFAGYGADLDPARAVFRAVTEAVQAHSVVNLGARDSFEGLREVPVPGAMLERQLELHRPESLFPFPTAGAQVFDELKAELDAVCEQLRRAGLERCLVADLTRADLEVPVVRVLVPGLAGPYGATQRRPPARLLQRLT
ncbi:MAG: YcaO-like family protein [Myxococcaceae bacterium]|nr:YcaO-like family protein [Myxococcaceae bacterium]